MMHRSANARRLAGFTLIEVLLVIVVISILSTLGLAVTSRVLTLNRARSTENVIRTLDQALENFVLNKGALPAPILKITAGEASRLAAGANPTDRAELLYLPMIDGRYVGGGSLGQPDRTFPLTANSPGTGQDSQIFDRDLDPPQPSGGLLLLALKQAQGDLGVLSTLDNRFLSDQVVSGWGWDDGNTPGATSQFGFASGNRPPLRLPVARDAWGRPIRFAHPAFQGGFAQCYGSRTDTVSRASINFAGSGSDTTFAQLVEGLTGTPRSGIYSRSARPFDPALTLKAPKPVGDADEGVSATRQAYFYSAGPGGNPGDRGGNVYTQAPTFPPETQVLSFD